MDTKDPRSIGVFLVDDSAPMRARLADMLAAVDGVEVAGEAADPAAAVKGILQTRPAIVVLDIHLAGGTGIDVLRAVRPVDSGIVFIVLTNLPTPQYRKAYMQAGASYFFDKATEFAAIRQTIAACAARAETAMHH